MEPTRTPRTGLTRRNLLRTGLGTTAGLTVAACSGGEIAGRRGGNVPTPVGVVRTSWSTDPWTLGSYSYLGVGATPDLRVTLGTAVGGGVLHLAGEHVAIDHPATVHGAAESGDRTADRILAAANGPERIVVVGAGVAGATVARRLADGGHEVLVVEGRDRVGGRIDTVRPAGWATPVERGASWVHDIAAGGLAGELARLEVGTVPFDYGGTVLRPDGTTESLEEAAVVPERALATALEWAEGRRDDVSLTEALVRSGAAADPAELDRFLRDEIVTEYGADPAELSARAGLAEGTEGDDVLVLGGYARLVEDLLDGVPTELGWPVAEVAHGPDGAIVTAVDGRSVVGDRVVVTLPLGVLRAGTVRFDPALPADHRSAIEGLSMGLLDKLWLRWDERWWGDHGRRWSRTAPADDPYVEWYDLSDLAGQAVLLALVGGSVAREWATRSDEEVLAAALRSLQAFRDAGW